MKEFKAGDRVVYGEHLGVVRSVKGDGRKYPVHVKFDNDYTASFTMDGKITVNDDYPSIFHVDEEN